MKLLVISAAYPPHQSGEATNAYHLCQHLADRGVDVEVLTTTGCVEHQHPRIRLLPVMKSWSWGEMSRLQRALKQSAPDAVLMIYIGWVYHHEFMATYAATICKQALPGVPFVTRFENAMGADPRHTSLWSRSVRKLMALRHGRHDNDYCYGTLLRDSDRLIVLSERHQRILAEVSSAADPKCVLIPPPPNMCVAKESAASCRADLRKRHNLPDDAFVLTYLGYMHAAKGLHTLLESFQKVGQERANLRLMLMGGTIDPQSGNPTSYVQELQAHARRLGVADKIIWTGAYSGIDDAASRLLFASDACVLPFAKGVHLNNSSFASASVHGLPIITTRADDLEEQFVHGDNVWLCPPQSAADLAMAISSVMDDGALRARLRRGIAALTQTWFSWDRCVEQTLAACGAAAAPSPLAA